MFTSIFRYGSVITAHLLQSPKISERIASVIMVDPVSILLHLPDVAYNFTIRRPRTANEWQLWYFASKDAGVAHTLSRHFFWSENILWKEDLANYQTTIFLSDRDLLVDTSQVCAYLLGLKKYKEKNVVVPGQDGKRLEVVWCTNLDHGQLFDSQKWKKRLLTEVSNHAAGSGARGR